jgi:predicted lipoprotein with Yx(FWY)xxD motif
MKRIAIALSSVILIIGLFPSCSKSDTVETARTDVHFDSTAALGKYLVDKDDRTLYYFSNDVNGASNCTGGCLTEWPVYYVDKASATFDGGLNAADFNTIITASGKPQTTYKGWPLYYYAPAGVPEAPKETKGEAVGNVWFVAKTNYSITIANYQLMGANGINYLSNYTPGNGSTNYLCDGNGNTLYFFARDSAFKNKFTRADFSNNATFPIYETDNITLPSILDKTLFAVIIFNGRKQLTYKGWPLYYFGADGLVRGSTKAVTFPATQPAGAVWPVATKDAVLAPR